jgi:cyanate lyase
MVMLQRSSVSTTLCLFLFVSSCYDLTTFGSTAHHPPSPFTSVTSKAERIERCIKAKSDAGLTYDDLASELGVTNAYAAQLILGQAKLSPETADKMRKVLPSLADEDIQDMQDSFPMRGFDDQILKEPNIYRTYEAITHYGEAIKCIINEQCGDGIMSAIDFYLDVGTTTGKNGEKRVVITFNGTLNQRSSIMARMTTNKLE